MKKTSQVYELLEQIDKDLHPFFHYYEQIAKKLDVLTSNLDKIPRRGWSYGYELKRLWDDILNKIDDFNETMDYMRHPEHGEFQKYDKPDVAETEEFEDDDMDNILMNLGPDWKRED